MKNRVFVEIDGPSPCFVCRAESVVEKMGKSLCRKCADTMRGQEYPVRKPNEHCYTESKNLSL